MPGYFVRQLSCLRLRPKTGFRLTGVILQAVCLLGLALLGRGPAGAAPPAGKLLVAATIVPLGDFCQTNRRRSGPGPGADPPGRQPPRL